VNTGAEEDESSTGSVSAAGFQHVMARSRLVPLFETYEPFISLTFKLFRAAVNREYCISACGGTTIHLNIINTNFSSFLLAYRYRKLHNLNAPQILLALIKSEIGTNG
jgi:hypothetical protein